MDVCRVCLSVGPDKHIYQLKLSHEDCAVEYAEIIGLCFGNEYLEQKTKVDKVCTICFNEILRYYIFKWKALKNDAYLRLIIPDLTGIRDTIENDIEIENNQIENDKLVKHTLEENIYNLRKDFNMETHENHLIYQDNDISIEINDRNVGTEVKYEFFDEADFVNEDEETTVEAENSDECESDDEGCNPGSPAGIESDASEQFSNSHIGPNPPHDPDLVPSKKSKGWKRKTGNKNRGRRPCPTCNKMLTESSLRKHIKRVHERLSKSCPYCKKEYSNLTSHIMTIHEPEKLKYDCSKCQKPSSFKDHVCPSDSPIKLNGNAEPPEISHICMLCEKRYRSAKHLQCHVSRVHKCIKRYLCHYCSKGFRTKDGIIVHIRSHTKEKPYQCDKCVKSFSTKTGLKNHQCEKCPNKSFKTSGFIETKRWRRQAPRKIGNHSDEQMQEALNYIKAGTSIRQAAEKFDIPCTTLQRYNKKQNSEEGVQRLTPNYAVRRIFTDDQENTLNEYFKNCAVMFYGLTRKNYMTVAYEMAILNNVKVPDNWEKNQIAGMDWLRGFRERFPDATVRGSEKFSVAVNKVYVDRFYDILQKVISRSPAYADGTRIYNLDEIATTTSICENPSVVTGGLKRTCKGVSDKNGTLVTTCNIISAGGQALPPVLVFPGEEVSPRMEVGTPPGSLILVNPSGCMNNAQFPEVIKHFVKHTGSTKDHQTLLIIDNHESHLSLKALKLAEDAGVTILTLHPHVSDKLQPLEVGINNSFQRHYASAMESWMMHNSELSVAIHEVGGLVGQAFDKAMTPANIKSAFKKTGIYPFDRNAYSEAQHANPDVALAGPSRTVPSIQVDEDQTGLGLLENKDYLISTKLDQSHPM